MPAPQTSEARIAEAAYFLWLDEGKPHGQDQDHWQRASAALTPAKPKKPRVKTAAKTVAKEAAKAKPAKPAAKAAKPRKTAKA